MSFKRKQAHPQQTNGKGKKPESTVNSQRIGITLKLEAIKTTLSALGQRKVLLMDFISESEIIHILMHLKAKQTN